jgi:YD repeat-containing protein
VTGAGTTSYTYDANGDLVSAGSNSYTYNLADHLASTTQWSTTTGYSYDGYGNRVESDTSGGADTTRTWDMIGQLPQIASEQAGSGTGLRTYLYGPQGAISITTPSQTTYLYATRWGRSPTPPARRDRRSGSFLRPLRKPHHHHRCRRQLTH